MRGFSLYVCGRFQRITHLIEEITHPFNQEI